MNTLSIENALSALAALMPKADTTLVETIAEGIKRNSDTVSAKREVKAARSSKCFTAG